MQQLDCVIGIDGGGSYTRVMAADLQGNVLSYAETGASSIYKDKDAAHNVREGIAAALQAASREAGHVKGLVAGVAGFDKPSDLTWVEELTAYPGIDCPRGHVNDAIIAHSGAFLTKPGVVVISGTGSIVVAITEQGRVIRNYDLFHYAASAARFLAYDLMYELLAGNGGPTDAELTEQTLAYWDATDLRELRAIALEGFVADGQQRNSKFGRMAPLVTEAALAGSLLARRICDRKVHEIEVAVRMLGTYFAGEDVSVACIGSVINSAYMMQQFQASCASHDGHADRKRISVIEPMLSPVAGAVLMAYKQLGLTWDEATVSRLLNHEKAAFASS
ncbi:MAG: ATPase [Paenibacillus sp.]|nr:ATPase [Paenibacillus sp.]